MQCNTSCASIFVQAKKHCVLFPVMECSTKSVTDFRNVLQVNRSQFCSSARISVLGLSHTACCICPLVFSSTMQEVRNVMFCSAPQRNAVQDIACCWKMALSGNITTVVSVKVSWKSHVFEPEKSQVISHTSQKKAKIVGREDRNAVTARY